MHPNLASSPVEAREIVEQLLTHMYSSKPREAVIEACATLYKKAHLQGNLKEVLDLLQETVSATKKMLDE